MSKICKSLFPREKYAGGVFGDSESDWNKVKQSCSQPEVKRWLWCMTWQFPPPPPSLNITITTPTPPTTTIPQIYCFKWTASQHDSIMQSILLGWLFRREIFDDMRTLRDPFILIWENNCVSSLKSVACGLYISLWPQTQRSFCASCQFVCVRACMCCENHLVWCH